MPLLMRVIDQYLLWEISVIWDVLFDSGLTMVPEYNAVYRRVEHKAFLLRKLRYFMDKKASLLVYKQAILPYIDNAGFILTACNLGQKRDLQILQNNALSNGRSCNSGAVTL